MPAAGDGAAAPADAAAGDVKKKNGKAAGKAKKAGGAGAGKAARAGKKRKKGSGGRGKGKGKKGANGAKGGKGGKGAKGGKGGKKRKRGAGKAKRRKALTAAQAAKYLLYFQVKAREKSINFYTKWWKELSQEGKDLQAKLQTTKDKMYAKIQTILGATEAMSAKMRKISGEQAEFERQMDLGKDMGNMKIRNDVEALRARLQSEQEEYDRCVKVIEKHLNQDSEVSKLEAESISLAESLRANREAHAARMSQIEQRREAAVASSAARTARILADMERVASDREVDRMPPLARDVVSRNSYLRRESDGVHRECRAVCEYIEALECRNVELVAGTSFPVDWNFGGLIDVEELERGAKTAEALEAAAAAAAAGSTAWNALAYLGGGNEGWGTDEDEGGVDRDGVGVGVDDGGDEEEEARSAHGVPGEDDTADTPPPKLRRTHSERSSKTSSAAGSGGGCAPKTFPPTRPPSGAGPALSRLSSACSKGSSTTALPLPEVAPPPPLSPPRSRSATGAGSGARSGPAPAPKLPRNPFPPGSAPRRPGGGSSAGKAAPGPPPPSVPVLPPLRPHRAAAGPSGGAAAPPGAKFPGDASVGPLRVLRAPRTLTPSALLRDEEAENARTARGAGGGVVVAGTRKPVSRGPPTGGPRFYTVHRVPALLIGSGGSGRTGSGPTTPAMAPAASVTASRALTCG